ncbi:hypothetical protein FRC17_001261 [Serendipita sp. 399]|nr:hypothetical protein FRC17_001261 [Serendipita sp. 399]
MMPQEHSRTFYERVHAREIADNRFVLIRNAFGDLTSQLALNRNNYASISKLMDDLLVEIWSYIPALDMFSVSGVCQRWRLLSVNTPKLWTDIDFDRLDKGHIELLLKRAKNSPLHISVNSSGSHSTGYSWRNQLQNRRSRIVQRQLDSHGWCDRGLVYDDSSIYSQPRHLKKHGEPKEYDDDDSDYEYLNPASFHSSAYALPVSRFDQIVPRAKSLRAMVGGEPSLYVTYETLSRPMPHLKRLSLIKDPGNIPWTSGGQSIFNHRRNEALLINTPLWFSGRAPNLRDLELSTIHPLWNDPIYSNLTRLRITMPEKKTRTTQLLRILQNCPELEYLDLTECVIRHSGEADPYRQWGPMYAPLYSTIAQEPEKVANETERDGETPMEGIPRIELKNLWYCHLQEPEAKPISDILSAIVCPRLETLVLCSSNAPLFGKVLNTMGKVHENFATTRHFPPQRNLDPYYQNCQLRLLSDLEATGMYYDRIEKIDIGGRSGYTDEFYEGIFTQFYNLRRLRLRLVPRSEANTIGGWGVMQGPPNGPAPKTAMEILSGDIADCRCPRLEEVYISWFSSTARELADWVEMRAAKVAKLKKLVVDVYEVIFNVPFPSGVLPQESKQPEMGEESSVLDEQSKARIEAALEQNSDSEEPAFVWGNPEREKTRKVYGYNQSLCMENDVEVVMED